LIQAVAGGAAAPGAIDVRPRPTEPVVVAVRLERVARLLGVSLSEDEIASLLEPIGFAVSPDGPALEVTVPGFRPDVSREVDLIEEIARRRGYDTFEEALRPFQPSNAPEDPMVPLVARVHQLFRRWGFLEARTAGFAPEAAGRVP